MRQLPPILERIQKLELEVKALTERRPREGQQSGVGYNTPGSGP